MPGTAPVLPSPGMQVLLSAEMEEQQYVIMDLRIRQQVRLIQEDFYKLGVYLLEAYEAKIWEHIPSLANWTDYLAQVGIAKSKASYLMALPKLVRPALEKTGLSEEAAVAEIVAVDETKYGILVPQMRDAEPEDILEIVRHAQQATWHDLREAYGPQPNVSEDEPWVLRVKQLDEDRLEIQGVVSRELLDRLVRRFRPVVEANG